MKTLHITTLEQPTDEQLKGFEDFHVTLVQDEESPYFNVSAFIYQTSTDDIAPLLIRRIENRLRGITHLMESIEKLHPGTLSCVKIEVGTNLPDYYYDCHVHGETFLHYAVEVFQKERGFGIVDHPYLFLRNTKEQSDKVYVAYASDFKEVPLSDTYASYGQLVEAENAGDHCEVLTDKAASLIQTALLEREYEHLVDIEKGDFIYASEDLQAYYTITKLLDDGTLSGEDIEQYKETCTAYTYWDGNNYQSIVIATEYGHDHLEWEECSAEEAFECILLIDNMQEVSTSDSRVIYEAENQDEEVVTIVESHYPTDWEYLTIGDIPELSYQDDLEY